MRTTSLVILFLFLGIPSMVHSQNKPYSIDQQHIYKDRITDEYGKPLSRIKVSVKGKGIYTYSDYDGNFSIKVSFGDEIVLSKDGKFINSYYFDNRLNHDYKVVDQSNTLAEKHEKHLNKVSKKSKRTVYYLDSAQYYLKKDPYKSISFIERQLQSNEHNSKTELVKSFTLLGDNYRQLKQYDLAVSNYQTALKNSKDINLQIKLAHALAKNRQFIISSANYNSLLKKRLSPYQKIIVNEGLGNNASKQNRINSAISYYKKALQIAQDNSVISKISSINAKIAELLILRGDKDESRQYIQNTLQTSSTGQIKKRVEAQNKAAKIYQSNKDFDSEIQLRKQALNELERAQIESIELEDEDNSNEKLTTSQLNLDIGRAYIDKKEYDKAIPYLEESIAKAGETENLEIQKNALQKLSELYKKIGNSKKALQNYQEYARLVNELYRQKEKEIKAATTLNNELRDKQNRINSLEKDRELSESKYKLYQSEQELTRANYRRQKMLIYGLMFGLLLLGIAIFFMYRSNKQRRLANNLLALKSLRSQMNPHFIFNALNSVNSFISQNDERKANRYLTDFSTLMRNVLNYSEKDFIPLAKEIELLKLYLQLEHSRFKDKFDYEINIDEQILLDEFQIPPMLLQPYVENAVWHGLRYKKSKGKLQIDCKQRDNKTVIISITDDGIGRKKSKELKTQHQKKQESKGMNNIKNRIKILNEMYHDKVDVYIENLNNDESGTKVILTLKKD